MEGEVYSGEFVKYFSGDVDGATSSDSGDEEVMEGLKEIETWATPYALSIMGKRYTNNCPYGTGDGYGDGRAISIGEVVVPFNTGESESSHESLYPKHAARFELQLKGAGQTPGTLCAGSSPHCSEQVEFRSRPVKIGLCRSDWQSVPPMHQKKDDVPGKASGYRTRE